MAFDVFKDAYGKPEDGTAAKREPVPDVIQPLADAGIGGIYEDGLVSLLSKREGDGDLGAWGAHLPKGARLFGSTGFGTLFAANDDEIWLVDTQYGQVIDAAEHVEEFLEDVANPEARKDAFREPLFKQWVEINGPPAHTDVLTPTPYLPLGGDWVLESLKPAKLAAYLGLTGQLFGPGTGLEIEYR